MPWRLFQKKPPPNPTYLPGDPDYGFEIVGESHYQAALEKLAGGRTRDGAFVECQATIIPERNNPHDANAVRVEIKDQVVGYFSREDAKLYRRAMGAKKAVVKAAIVGGWDRGSSDRGSFGVKLAVKFATR